jgi:hypothetical protein
MTFAGLGHGDSPIRSVRSTTRSTLSNATVRFIGPTWSRLSESNR